MKQKGMKMNEKLEGFIEDFREFVLDGMDAATLTNGVDEVKDSDLPELFRFLDKFAEELWNRNH